MEPKRYFINNLPDEPSTHLDAQIQKKRIDDLVDSIIKGFSIKPKNADGGLYVGLAGISYMFYHISKIPSFQHKRQEYLSYGQKFVETPLQMAWKNKMGNHVTDKTGFLTGNAGIFAVAAVIYKKLGMDGYEEILNGFRKIKEYVKPLNWFDQGGDELFVGRAGYLCALIWLRRELHEEVIPDSEAEYLLNAMIESGRHYSHAKRSSFPLMYHYYGTEYLGPAHGISGILFVMLCFPDWMERNHSYKELIKESIDSILKLQTPAGNFPCAMDEIGGGRPASEELVHWCHGGPGVVYLLAKAYLVFNEEKYLTAALKCGEITWQKGLLKKGPGICHGVSGSGYVFLLLYRLTNDPKHLKRAEGFMDFIYSQDFSRARQPDSPFSLFEGIGGTVCFAADLTNPTHAEYPFFGV